MAKSNTPEYRAWSDMKQRCNNPNNRCYQYYGARGITYDPRWESFDAFIEDMGFRPSPQHTLDRTDCNGNYELSNCRWVTQSENLSNRRLFFIRKSSPTRYIHKCRNNRFRVKMLLRKGKMHYKEFKTLEEAMDYRSDTEMEREMHRRLS